MSLTTTFPIPGTLNRKKQIEIIIPGRTSTKPVNFNLMPAGPRPPVRGGRDAKFAYIRNSTKTGRNMYRKVPGSGS